GNDNIVASDIGAEKFTVITVPNFILNQPTHVYSNGDSSNHLIELESRLALLSRMSDYSAKLWVFDDVRGNNKEKNRSTSSSIAGTNKIVIETHDEYSIFTRHSYNWIAKSCKKIEISGRGEEEHELQSSLYPEDVFEVLRSSSFQLGIKLKAIIQSSVRGHGYKCRRAITRLKPVMNVVCNNNMIRKQKRKNKRSRGAGGNISLSNSASTFHDDSAIVCEILSRLPVSHLFDSNAYVNVGGHSSRKTRTLYIYTLTNQ
ncbi:hypothetical protein C5167_028079, partial [Papaver somniferum]